jgi:BMFP domain-containing protein YqiC
MGLQSGFAFLFFMLYGFFSRMRATPEWPAALAFAGLAPTLGACATRVHALNQREAHKKSASGFTQGASLRTEMDMNNFFNDLQGRINQAIENSPAKDIERNVKAMMTQGFSKLDLVTREEFDIQAQVLAKTRAKLDALELRVAELEAKLASEQKV